MAVTFDPVTFRVLFPQFADETAWPDLKLVADYNLATVYISPESYGDISDDARQQMLNLMTAHLLALGVIIAQNNYSGQVGVVQGATVDGVSVTLSPPPQRSQWRWWLNTTPYGAQLSALLDVLSAGGFFVGGLPERAAFRRVGGGFGGIY